MRRLLVLALLLAACSRKQPNVLLVTFDTTRADHIDGRITPNVMALAKDGTFFVTAIASQPLTAPSHATILTGSSPYRHGVRNNGAYVLAKENVTLAERLRAAGYATHAIVAAYVLDSRFGFDQGFDSYDDDLSLGVAAGGGQREIDARRVADKAIRWLGLTRDKPFFLWLHFYDPHAGYTPPPDVAAAFPGDPYSGEIHYADRELGRVLAWLRAHKQIEDTLVVFTADHGESLGEHGEAGHGLFVYDATTRVPLIFAGPRVPRGRRLDWVAGHTDIVPTVLDLLDQDAQSNGDGASLAQWWDGSAPPDRHAYSETIAGRTNFGWSELRSLRSRTTRVIEAPRREAYDLAHDPAEQHNVSGGDTPAGARPLFAELARVRARDDLGRPASAVDEETRRKLASLGYVMGSSAAMSGAPVDPKDRVGTWQNFQEAQALLRRHELPAATEALRSLAATEPRSDAVAMLLATALRQGGRRAEALDVLKQIIERDPRNAAASLARASLLREAGRGDEARTLIETVLRLDPGNADGRVALADLAMDEGRTAVAEAILRDALRRDPRSSVILAALGDTLHRSGRPAQALALLEQAHRDDPNSHLVAYNYAVVLERTGHPAEALQAYRAALRLDPEHSMTWNNVGSLLDRAGKRREAMAFIARAHRLDPGNVEATYNLGALLLVTGHAKEAVPLLEQAVALRPDLAAARQRLAAARAQRDSAPSTH
ncbi:MAG: sulfatase-like hydrolase/transferase [Acidobacteriota bacterium]